MNLSLQRVVRPFCVFCIICIGTCFLLSCGASTDQTSIDEPVTTTQDHVPFASFQDILHSIEPLNNHIINFSNSYPGYVIVLCPLYEFTIRDFTCSENLLAYYNQLHQEAEHYQVPFFLLLDRSDGKSLQEYTAFLNEKFEIEPDFAKTDKVNFSYPLYFDQYDQVRDSYFIPVYPSILFLDSNGEALRIKSGYSQKTQQENLEILKELYSQQN